MSNEPELAKRQRLWEEYLRFQIGLRRLAILESFMNEVNMHGQSWRQLDDLSDQYATSNVEIAPLMSA